MSSANVVQFSQTYIKEKAVGALFIRLQDTGERSMLLDSKI